MSTLPPTPVAETLIGTLPAVHVPSSDRSTQDSFPTVSGYEIQSEIGRGGMGVVYRAVQLSLRRVVALKMLPGGNHPSEVFVRFRQEGEAVARLQHPNIVQIHEIGMADGRPFLALEFVEGGSLAQAVARQPQPPRVAAALMETLAQAVQHAHDRGMIHRDLKPGNVLIQPGEANLPKKDEPGDRGMNQPAGSSLQAVSPKITDFGLAKLLASPDGPTQAGDILGTPSYMAPEQAAGVTRTLTTAVDVYALGAILYELLTGSPPFLGADATETVLQVLSQEPVPVRQIRPDCPRDLETICLKCLEKTPGKRYRSAAAFAEDLHRFLADEAILARPAGPVERLAKWSRRNPAAAALVGGAIVTGITLLGMGTVYALQLKKHNYDLGQAVEREQKARERERIAREQAQANFRIARQTVKDLLAEVATKDLESVPYMDPVRRRLLEKAVKSQTAFLQQDRDNSAVKQDLADVFGDIGEIHDLLGDKVQAEFFMNDAITIQNELLNEDVTNAQNRHNLAMAQMRLGSVLMPYRPLDAEKLFTQSYANLEMLTRDHPGESSYGYDLNRVRLNRGGLYISLERTKDAETEFKQALDAFQRFVTTHPETPDYQDRLAVTHYYLARMKFDRSEYREASIEYSKALQVLKPLTEKYPERRSSRLHLGLCYRNAGAAIWWMTSPTQDKALNDRLLQGADSAYRLSVDAFTELSRDFPGIPDYRHSLARSLDSLSEFLEYEHRSGGPPLLNEAMKIKQQLVQEQPQNPSFRGSLAVTCGIHAAKHRRQKEWASAKEWEVKALTHLRECLALNPQAATFRDNLSQNLRNHADTLIELKDPVGAAAALDEFAHLTMRGKDELFLAACQLGKCMKLVSDENLKKQYADHAMDLLRRALKAEFNDFKQINEAPELELLRKRPDWKSLPIPSTPATPPSKPSPPS